MRSRSKGIKSKKIKSKKLKGSYCKAKDLKLYSYQRQVAQWFKAHPKQKGMLIQFGTGTGKTLVAANLGEMMVKKGVVSGVLVITPTSLIHNFEKAIRMCRGSSSLPDHYLVESYGRARNMVEARKARDPAGKTKYPSIGWFGTKAMEDTLLILDEAHNLKNASSKTTRAIMSLARKAKHVLLLTATPFVNSVTDIAPLMQMIVKDADIKLWPTQEKAFRSTYEGRAVRYKRNLRSHIAYHFDDAKGLKPKVVQHLHKVDLAKEQLGVIQGIRAEMGKEVSRLLRAYLREEGLPPGTNLSKLNAYLIRIRQAANSLHGECSPKVKALVAKAMAGPKPAVIYSEFKAKGVETVRDCLVKEGVTPAKIGYFHGGLTKKERDGLVKDYNKGLYDYLLITAAGSEGLSLRATRQVHVLEPFWNAARILQVLGRGVRVDSHGHLPKKDRRVDLSYWISVVSEEDKKAIGKAGGKTEDKDLTTLQPDVHVWAAAQRKDKEMKSMNAAHKERSILTRFSHTKQKRKQKAKRNTKTKITKREPMIPRNTKK